MSREVHVRFCESRGVRFPPATLPVVMVAGARGDAEALWDEVAAVLAPMGLRLSEAKTRVCHIDEGFDFLGWRIQRRCWRGRTGKQAVYTYPSKKALASVMAKVRSLTRRAKHRTLADLLRSVNPVPVSLYVQRRRARPPPHPALRAAVPCPQHDFGPPGRRGPGDRGVPRDQQARWTVHRQGPQVARPGRPAAGRQRPVRAHVPRRPRAAAPARAGDLPPAGAVMDRVRRPGYGVSHRPPGNARRPTSDGPRPGGAPTRDRRLAGGAAAG